MKISYDTFSQCYCGTYSGTSIPGPFTSNVSGTSMVVTFHTDGSGTGSGFRAVWTETTGTSYDYDVLSVNETVADNVGFVITPEGLLSLVLVQLPGFCLGVFGIMKAFLNHGMTSQAAKDSLRSSSCAVSL